METGTQVAVRFLILNRWSGAVQFECELPTEIAAKDRRDQIGYAVRQAIASCSNLRDSDLSGSNLRGSNLRDSDLSGSNLRGSDLCDSDLSGSNLRGSDLCDSDLRGSDLSDSDLRDSDLSGSDLRGSNLRGSNLSGSDLSDSNLTPIRDDLWAVLAAAPREAEGLRAALAEGRIDGTAYQGECACLVGTIANIRQVEYNALGNLHPNSHRPAERFFLAIKTGDKPETNQFSKLSLEWTDEFIANMRSAFGPSPQP